MPGSPAHKWTAVLSLFQGAGQTCGLASACGINAHRAQPGRLRAGLGFRPSHGSLGAEWPCRAVLDGGGQAFYLATYWGELALRAGASLSCAP